MSDADRKTADAATASHEVAVRNEVKRRALFGMATKTAFIAPVIFSFALDPLTIDAAHAANGSGSGSGSAVPSDIRLKQNIKRVGTHALGIGLYEYSYIGSPARFTGVMAQEVLTVAPHAVITTKSGIMMVNYAALGC